MPTLSDIVSDKSCQSFLGHPWERGFPFRIRYFLVFCEVLNIYKALSARGVGPNTADPFEFRGQGRDIEFRLVGKRMGVDLHWDPPETSRPVCELQHRNEQQASVRSA